MNNIHPYNAKILLFGEYGIIKDAMGLSIPYDFYKGALVFSPLMTESERQSNAEILKFCHWIKELNNDASFTAKIDTDAMEKDLQNGLYFNSSIPLGYGVGSSGAVVAAIYSRYALKAIPSVNISAAQIIELKNTLGRMESFFHGKSSGLDPLICYLNLPILIRSKEEISPVGIPEQDQNGRGAIFLLDTGQIHSTGGLIDIFFEKMKNKGFRKMLKDEFSTLSEACIDAFLHGKNASLMENMRGLSKVVFEHFSPMIPQEIRSLWLKGLQTDSYYLKLCGAGGGGFMLGFTEDYTKASEMLKDYNTQPIYRF
ncbi:MAG: mevalonate kinase [Flavobacteriales bacterium]|nr:mevalonate kinase [Flavobacteriales bacterium]